MLASASLRGATDVALVRGARLGDREAFAELFTRHSAMTFRYAVRMLDGDQHTAQDVVQEAWIKAWRHVVDFRGDAAFRTWLLRIVTREVYSARRRRRPIPVDDAQLAAYWESRAGSSQTWSRHEDLADALSLELARLPWRQRQVWLLRETEELSYAQIAEVLGVTETVVRGQLHRARTTLAIRMEDWR